MAKTSEAVSLDTTDAYISNSNEAITVSPDLFDKLLVNCTFQTFDDTSKKRQTLAKILHGSLDELKAELIKLNKQGAGVFATINETDGTGRKKENITAVRSLFADFDTVNPARIDELMSLDFPPTSIIESSPGKHHAYWITDDFSLNKFSEYQVKLAQALGSDTKIKDLSRVMRVPGFYHQKGDKFLTRIVGGCNKKYKAEKLIDWIDGLETLEVNSVQYNKTLSTVFTAPSQPDTEAQALFWKLTTELESAEEGNRNDILFKVALQLYGLVKANRLSKLAVHGALKDVAVNIGLSLSEINTTLKSAWKSAKADINPLDLLPKLDDLQSSENIIIRDVPLNYPIDALGPLTDVCRYMVNELQLPVETAGQSLLATAALLAQSQYDVETLNGNKPLSIYALTLAASGDGKSTADDLAQKRLLEADKAAHDKYLLERSIWEALPPKQRKITPPPKHSYLRLKDATLQGIIKSFKDGGSSQGSFTQEAGAMLAGWGMSSEQKTNTLAGLNSLWDGSEVSICRQGEGRTQLYGTRFSAHWMVQPLAAQTAMYDPLFCAIGAWPRFMVVKPAQMKPRKYKPSCPEKSPEVINYWTCCDKLLESSTTERKVISLSDDAHAEMVKFWEEMELSRNPSDLNNFIKEFCVRATEQACRVAGVLTAFRNNLIVDTDLEISVEDSLNAIALVRFSLATWRQLLSKQSQDEAIATKLYEWIKKRRDQQATNNEIIQNAVPRSLRNRDTRNMVLGILSNAGYIVEVSKNTWKIKK